MRLFIFIDLLQQCTKDDSTKDIAYSQENYQVNSIPTYPAMTYDCAVCGTDQNTVNTIPAKHSTEATYLAGICKTHNRDIFGELIRMEDEWQRQEKEWQRRTTSIDLELRNKNGEGTHSVGDALAVQMWRGQGNTTGANDNIYGVVRRLYRSFGWGARRITRLIHKSYGLRVSRATVNNYLTEIRNEGVVPAAYIENPVFLDKDKAVKNILWKAPDYTRELEKKAKAQETSTTLVPFTLVPENIHPPKDGSVLTQAQREGKEYLLPLIKYATVTNQM